MTSPSHKEGARNREPVKYNGASSSNQSQNATIKSMIILTVGNPKLKKNLVSLGYINAGLSLLPAKLVNNYTDELSGVNLCPWSTEGCRINCCNKTGRGKYKQSQMARARRTIMYKTEPDRFFALLEEDLLTLQAQAVKREVKAACRLNIYSDVSWENHGIIQKYPSIQFYDYTKSIRRAMSKDMPSNYHLTFSRSEDNVIDCWRALSEGVNVAVVFKNTLPSSWMGVKVVNGMNHDLIFLHESPRIIGLKKLHASGGGSSNFFVDHERAMAELTV
jgi:hypothetical protein